MIFDFHGLQIYGVNLCHPTPLFMDEMDTRVRSWKMK